MKKRKYYLEGAFLTLFYLLVGGFIVFYNPQLLDKSIFIKILFFPAKITLNPILFKQFTFNAINFSLFGLYFIWSFFCVGLDMLKRPEQRVHRTKIITK